MSSWLRDYLYIPLGGNRGGFWYISRNFMLTMLLGGLWHGASWTFVLWGFLHGLYLMVERGIKAVSWPRILNSKVVQWLLSLLTLLFVVWAFVVFRAENMTQVRELFAAMFSINQIENSETVSSLIVWGLWTQMVVGAFVMLLLTQWLLRARLLNDVVVNMVWWQRSVLLFGFIVLIVLGSGENDAFIYFQF